MTDGGKRTDSRNLSPPRFGSPLLGPTSIVQVSISITFSFNWTWLNLVFAKSMHHITLWLDVKTA